MQPFQFSWSVMMCQWLLSSPYCFKNEAGCRPCQRVVVEDMPCMWLFGARCRLLDPFCKTLNVPPSEICSDKETPFQSWT